MSDPKCVKLLFGPYRPPALRRGDLASRQLAEAAPCGLHALVRRALDGAGEGRR